MKATDLQQITKLCKKNLIKFYCKIPTEKQICEDGASASGKTVDAATKNRRLSCQIKCKYSDGSEDDQNSPDGQMCDDMVGIAPTGVCRDGRCAVGGIGK